MNQKKIFTTSILVKLTENQKTAIRSTAERLDCSMNEVCRWAIKIGLKKLDWEAEAE